MLQYTVPLNQIHDLRPVAESLSGLLTLSSNADIAKEFPQTVEHLGDPERAAQNLAKARERFSEGEYEDIVLFVGKVAVGMSLVAKSEIHLLDMDPDNPILASYVCNPYRGRGLGRLSMNVRLAVVNKRFGGHAVTMVKHENVVSIGLVCSSGFVLTGSNANSGTYTYGNQY